MQQVLVVFAGVLCPWWHMITPQRQHHDSSFKSCGEHSERGSIVIITSCSVSVYYIVCSVCRLYVACFIAMLSLVHRVRSFTRGAIRPADNRALFAADMKSGTLWRVPPLIVSVSAALWSAAAASLRLQRAMAGGSTHIHSCSSFIYLYTNDL